MTSFFPSEEGGVSISRISFLRMGVITHQLCAFCIHNMRLFFLPLLCGSESAFMWTCDHFSQNNHSKFIVVQGSAVHNIACTQQYIPVYLKICSEGRSQGVSVLTTKQRTKGQKEMYGGDGHVCYLGCGDGNTSGHVCPNTVCTLIVWSLLCTRYIYFKKARWMDA